MELHFCDVCNESVPEAHLLEGKAVRRGERVVCAACEAAMSGSAQQRSSAAGSPASAPVPGAGERPAAAVMTHAPGAHPRRSSGGLGLALLALLLAGGSTAFFLGEIDDLRSEQGEARRRIEQRLDALSAQVGALAPGLERLSETVRAAPGALMLDVQREIGPEIAGLRRDLELRSARLDALEQAIGGLSQQLGEGDASTQKRLDELFAQLARSRQDASFFGERLAALEQTVQGKAAPAGSAEIARAPAPPAWMASVPELASSSAGARWNAVQALGESGDPAVVPHLVPLLADRDVFVRMAVARVLGDLGAPAAIEPLIGALEDEDAAVREMASVALRTITGRDFKFDAVASPAERSKKVKAWQQWWKKAKEEYFPGSGSSDAGESSSAARASRR